nr:unnamed protein product [Digitaria exilis]
METTLVAIPDDALADALRRLPARSLATARCVCKAWRGIVDGRGLLLPHLLPHSVRGIFINYIDHRRPHLFARPSSAAIPKIDAMLSFLPNNDDRRDWWSVMDHCDGLLVFGIKWHSRLCVGNPATRRWTLLPERTEGIAGYAGAHLVFDPATSPHYEVILIPAVPKKPRRPLSWKVKKKKKCLPPRQHEIDGPFCLQLLFSSLDDALLSDEGTQDHGEEEFQPAAESAGPVLPCVDEDEDEDKEPDDPYRLMEWPPSPCQLNVFSSRTGQWEAKSFIRDGDPVGTVEDVRSDLSKQWLGTRHRSSTIYQNRTLYVHCGGSFIMRQ